MVKAGHFLLASLFVAGCCNNGEGGKGPCYAHTDGEAKYGGYTMVTSSFGPAGRREAVKTALAHCGLPQKTDPSEISFADRLTYTDEQGREVEPQVIDIDYHFFKCPEPGKDTQ